MNAAATKSRPMPHGDTLRRIAAADLESGAAFWSADAFVPYRHDPTTGRVAFIGIHNLGRRYTVESVDRLRDGSAVVSVIGDDGERRCERAPVGAAVLVEVTP